MPSFWGGSVVYFYPFNISTRNIISFHPNLHLFHIFQLLQMHVFKKQINIFAFMLDPAFNNLCPFIQDAVVFHTLLNKQSMQVNT